MPREYPRFQTNIPEKIAHPQRAAYPPSATAACASAGLRKR